jgi:serine/threonine protein phosphatase PrpC
MESFGLSNVGSSGVNADRYYISSDNNVYAISDGASGAFDKVGAATICMNSISERDYSDTGFDPIEYLKLCIKNANGKLIEKSLRDECLSFGTMTIALLDKNKLYIGAVGDTPAYLIKDNEIFKGIKPKRRYSDLIKYGVLSEEEIEAAIALLPNQMWSQFDKQ